MRRSRSSALVLLVGCGAAPVFHKEPERGCPVIGETVIAAQEDVAAYAGCARLGTLVIRTGHALDLRPFGRLETLEGDLRIGPSVGLALVALPRLREVRGAVAVTSNSDLAALQLPALERAARIEVAGNVDLQILDLAVLDAAVERSLVDNPKLLPLDPAPDAE
jgi:hypothetical protein